MSAAAQEQEENHWPGFVDALSTIVMVVTFLLIILAVAIFALSLNIAKVAAVTPSPTETTNIANAKEILVESAPSTLEDADPARVIRQSDKALVLRFDGATLDIDKSSSAQMMSFIEEEVPEMQEAGLAITAYFDAEEGGYAKRQRMGYYRVMAVRNELLRRGRQTDNVQVFVREAGTKDQINTVEITRRN